MPFETIGLDDIRENCTDWPKTTTNFSRHVTCQDINMNVLREKTTSREMVTLDQKINVQEIAGDDPRIERGVSNMSSMHSFDIGAEPCPDGVHVKNIVGINRRLCEQPTIDRIIRDVCDRFQMLGSVLQDMTNSV